MRNGVVLCTGAAAICFASLRVSLAENFPSRVFGFTYSATIENLAPGQQAHVWLPVATSSADQDVEITNRSIPGEMKPGRDAKYGNSILYFESKADANGCIDFSLTYHVTRRTVGRGDASQKALPSVENTALYLKADALVPIGGKPATLLTGHDLPASQIDQARLFYDLVDAHMTYRKDKPGWGRGDAAWACESGFGNCTDFHSLFISLARTQGIPAKFEIGFAIPESKSYGAPAKVAGYHCWAKFKPDGGGWIPVDISEANLHPELKDHNFGTLSPDRVMFSEGRDLMLVPQQKGPPVNYLVYPYVEADGQVWPQEKIDKHFSYRDRPAADIVSNK